MIDNAHRIAILPADFLNDSSIFLASRNNTTIMPHTLFRIRTAILCLACASLPALTSADTDDQSEQAVASAQQHRFEPVTQQIEGWTVYVDPKMLKGADAEKDTEALKMLANHLQRIAVLMPEKSLAEIRNLDIWIEHDHPFLNVEPGPYHPSADWLIDHGHDARLAKKVHVTRAASLLERHHMVKHPMVILHELAHSYHDQVLGFDEPRIKEAYDLAMKEGLYDETLLYNGEKKRAYAATNPMEYFAEGTEAYFYKNDFYPFVRVELEKHDPRLHALLVEIWGPLE